MKADSNPKMMEWKAGKAYEVEAHMGMVSGRRHHSTLSAA